MQILGWIIFGLIAGIVAKLLMPGKDPGGFIITILLGIAGSLIGGYCGKLLGIGGGGFVGFVMAVIGAMLLLLLYRLVKGKATA
ncbi:MAG TPA: GlsB/YeaQ/YmgE family stress response membrane protein [Blastocatellia bacterium]|nr:GlsB/YeaQ/YmgE family stress response membrane protein [Blastocatellia bacterium]